MTQMLAGIIGGTGQMGRFFAGVFEAAGWEVIVSGRKTPGPTAISQRPQTL